MGFVDRDLQRVWHPCMQMKEFETIQLHSIRSACGVWLEDHDGNRYIDAISSWWVNLFGHSNKYLNSKLTEQLEFFSHVMTANFTHEPMVRLSERLCLLTKLDKIFFADNGSSAVEASLKMAFQYHKNRGAQKYKFICFENSYHGETIGALSVGSVSMYKNTFKELLFQVSVAKTPKDSSEEETKKALDYLEITLESLHGEVAAVIIEPLVQCAGGMQMHSPDFLRGVRELCTKFETILILDEIAVGFGRTGTMFAHQQADILPDIMCLSKGITGGYMPLAVALCTQKIYDAFYDDYESNKAFLHSHSYSGNALSCSLANGVLDIFENSDTFVKISQISKHISEKLSDIKKHKNAAQIRQCGCIAAIETKSQDRLMPKIFEVAMKKGVFLRPLGNVIYTMPPLIIDNEEIDLIFDAVGCCLDVI